MCVTPTRNYNRSMSLNEIEQGVLLWIGELGGVTSRRTQQVQGPRPNWHRLIRENYVREYSTVYGKVLGLTAKGRAVFKDQNFPYLASPSTVVDRAYLNDALSILLGEGYKVAYVEHQRASPKQGGGLHRTPATTDVIVRTTLRVPERLADQIYADTRYEVKPLEFVGGRNGVPVSQLGYPYLYASIRNGGITPAALKRLHKLHRFDIDQWHHPLLLAVPDPKEFHRLLRKLEIEYTQDSPSHYRFGFSRVRLIRLPCPAAN